MDMVETGDFSAASCRPYHDKWMKAFGYDFGMVRHGEVPIETVPELVVPRVRVPWGVERGK